MATWPIGLSTGCFYQTNILDCLDLIRESGFSMIEVCFSPNHLDFHDSRAVLLAANRISVLGMEAYSFHAPFAHGLDISSLNADERERGLNEILQAAEAAALLQVHYLVIHPGPETSTPLSNRDRLQRMENTISVLNRVAERCRTLGIGCALENKLPHLLFGKTSDVLWILDAMESTNVSACLDTGHAFLSGDLQPLIHRLSRRISMIHVHDNSGHGDDHLPPGEGTIDWNQTLQLLGAQDFRGALILELAGDTNPAATMDRARRGRAYLRRISRTISLAHC